MEIENPEAAYVLGGLVLFHGAGRLLGFGGSRAWNHQVMWMGITAGSTLASALLFCRIMPWGYPDAAAIAEASRQDVAYHDYYRLYLTCSLLIHLYYAITSVLVDWCSTSCLGRSREGHWPGVWWTLTHLVILPLTMAAMIYEAAQTLRVPTLGRFVSLGLRYQIWLTKDSAISLGQAMVQDDDSSAENNNNHDDDDTRWWITFNRIALHIARVHSLFQLAQWWQACIFPAMGGQWHDLLWAFSWTGQFIRQQEHIGQ